jgi:uncharacterized protein YcbK (DUF882 family)
VRKIFSALAAAVVVAISGFVSPAPAKAGEVRTLSLFQVHTKEALTITYKVDGRHVPAAMDKINYILRDWRKNAVTRIDPKMIDLMWELHEDLGSTRPISIISGYRSAATNAFLSRIGRNVARRSQHIQGKAIDLYFPDVPTVRIRNSALVRQIGGVGFYPRSGVSGFVHIDSGSVRHWPRIPAQQLAQIMREYRPTIGARLSRPANIMVAALDTSSQTAKAPGNPQKITGPLYNDVPKPRARPLEVLVLAAQRMQIEPAAWPVQHKNFAGQPPITGPSLAQSLGPIARLASVDGSQRSNISAKGSLALAVREGTAQGLPLLKPLEASASDAGTLAVWSGWLSLSPDALFRRDGQPQPFVVNANPGLPESASGLSPEDSAALHRIITADIASKVMAANQASTSNRTAKADMLAVNRARKGDFGRTETVSASVVEPPAQDKFAMAAARVAQRAKDILRGAEMPIGFQ